MPSRLILAFALSLALHGGLLLPEALQRLAAPPPPPPLQATLRLPPKAEAPVAEPLLKNTLDAEEAPLVAKPLPPAATQKATSRAASKREVQAAQKRLSQHLYYPAEAVNRGLEGEVRLIVKLADDGSIDDVHIAASSGYPILDNAAIKAAYAMGRLAGSNSRELILPVIFHLQ